MLTDEEAKKWRHEYYLKNIEKIRKVNLEYSRQHRLGCNGGKYYNGLNKRQRPDDICEVCNRKVHKLDYHHWDDSNLNVGIWVCPSCHRMCEQIDKGFDSAYKIKRQQITEEVKDGSNR